MRRGEGCERTIRGNSSFSWLLAPPPPFPYFARKRSRSSLELNQVFNYLGVNWLGILLSTLMFVVTVEMPLKTLFCDCVDSNGFKLYKIFYKCFWRFKKMHARVQKKFFLGQSFKSGREKKKKLFFPM